MPKEKRLQLRECHGEFGDVIVVQFEGAPVITVPAIAGDTHV